MDTVKKDYTEEYDEILSIVEKLSDYTCVLLHNEVTEDQSRRIYDMYNIDISHSIRIDGDVLITAEQSKDFDRNAPFYVVEHKPTGEYELRSIYHYNEVYNSPYSPYYSQDHSNPKKLLAIELVKHGQLDRVRDLLQTELAEQRSITVDDFTCSVGHYKGTVTVNGDRMKFDKNTVLGELYLTGDKADLVDRYTYNRIRESVNNKIEEAKGKSKSKGGHITTR